jgi:hypothetical protein
MTMLNPGFTAAKFAPQDLRKAEQRQRQLAECRRSKARGEGRRRRSLRGRPALQPRPVWVA